MAPTSNRVAVAVNMLIIHSRVVVAVRMVSPPNCGAAIEKGPLQVMVDSAVVPRIFRPRILRRVPGRSSGADGATENAQRAKIRKHDFPKNGAPSL